MSEIVDRVARAIYAAAWGFGHPPPTGVELEEARAQASAAIEAMREPTEAMVKAAIPMEFIGHPDAKASSVERFFSGHRKAARKKWRAMIDEALK